MRVVSYKWQKLLWSIVLLGALIVISVWKTSNFPRELGDRFDLFGIFISAWFLTLIVSPVLIIFRLFRIFVGRESFFYIFIGLLNLFFAVIFFYEVISDRVISNDAFQSIAALINLISIIFISLDVFIVEIPGIRKTRETAK